MSRKINDSFNNIILNVERIDHVKVHNVIKLKHLKMYRF